MKLRATDFHSLCIFLEGVSPQDIVATFPDKGVPQVIAVEDASAELIKLDVEFDKALKELEAALNGVAEESKADIINQSRAKAMESEEVEFELKGGDKKLVKDLLFNVGFRYFNNRKVFTNILREFV